MSTTYVEVRNALELLSPMVMTLADAGLEIGAQVCANLIYGLQNCSCEEESVRRILFVALSFVKDLIAGLTGAAVGTQSAASVPTNPSNLSDALCIHQAISLSLQVLPGLAMDTDLNAEMRSIQEQIYRAIESRKTELTPKKLSTVEKRLADSISDVLADEPFIVTLGELLHGFESCITIRLRPGLNLMAASGVEWSPVLNIEIAGPHDSCPREELFNRLRAQYLFQEKSVVVQTIPFSSLAGHSRTSLRDLLRSSNDLFNAIYPPTVEDATNFNTILKTMGVLKGDGLLSSLSSDNRYPLEANIGGDNISSFFSLGNGDIIARSASDDFDQVHPDEAVDYFDARGPINTVGGGGAGPIPGLLRLQQSNHIAVGWIGDMPVVSISSHTTPSTSPVASYSNHVANRRSPLSSKIYKTVSTSPMPPGYSARTVYPPFVQIGPPLQQQTAASPTPLTSPRIINTTNGNGINKPPTSPTMTSSPKPSQVSYNPSNRVSSSTLISSSVSSQESDISRNHTSNTTTTSSVTAGIVEEPEAVNTAEAETVAAENVELEVDGEIAFLEAQLEIKRLEAKLLMLKKAKKPVTPAAATASPQNHPNGGVTTTTQSSHADDHTSTGDSTNV